MKKVIVTLASVALAGAVNFGVASAHPSFEPAPPASPAPNVVTPGSVQGSEVDEEQQGDNQTGDQTDSADAAANQGGEHGEAKDAAGNSTEADEKDMNDTQDQQGQQGQNDRNTQQDGEFEGDN